MCGDSGGGGGGGFNMSDSVLHSPKKCSLNRRNNKLVKVERR